MQVAIVGAGMAGLACAEALCEAGLDVALFDKGRVPGGRMSTRRIATDAGEAGFDYGAQYFTVRDPAFRRRVDRWQDAGLVAPWPAAGAEAWVGTPGMSGPVRQMAATLDVRWSAPVDALARDGDRWCVAGHLFDAAMVAVPAEQAASLLRPWQQAFAARATATRSAPCWTLMAAFAEPVPIGADVLGENGTIGWAARDSAKPGRSGPESWVVQAAPDWSRAHLEESAADVARLLLAAFAARAGVKLPEPAGAVAHRWRYARSGASGDSCLWDPELRLGVCGDWLLGARVEAAWLSGRRLAAVAVAEPGRAAT